MFRSKCELRGKRYKLLVYEGVLAWTHGMGHFIEEIYLPELSLAFNLEGGAFKPDPDRYKDAEHLGDVEVADEDAKILAESVELKEKVTELAKKYIKERTEVEMNDELKA